MRTRLVEACKVFDGNGNDLITTYQLRQVMKNNCDRLTNEEVDKMIREADVNEEGRTNYIEFVRRVMAKLSAQDQIE